MTMTCARCSEPFKPGSNRARYCSPECRRAVRRARTPKAEPGEVIGNRREGFRVVIDGVEGRWVPSYLREDRERLPRISSGEDLRAMPTTYDGAKSGGGIDRRRKALARDAARLWALDTFGVDIGSDLP
jgi:hypothetical protein